MLKRKHTKQRETVPLAELEVHEAREEIKRSSVEQDREKNPDTLM